MVEEILFREIRTCFNLQGDLSRAAVRFFHKVSRIIDLSDQLFDHIPARPSFISAVICREIFSIIISAFNACYHSGLIIRDCDLRIHLQTDDSAFLLCLCLCRPGCRGRLSASASCKNASHKPNCQYCCKCCDHVFSRHNSFSPFCDFVSGYDVDYAVLIPKTGSKQKFF